FLGHPVLSTHDLQQDFPRRADYAALSRSALGQGLGGFVWESYAQSEHARGRKIKIGLTTPLVSPNRSPPKGQIPRASEDLARNAPGLGLPGPGLPPQAGNPRGPARPPARPARAPPAAARTPLSPPTPRRAGPRATKALKPQPCTGFAGVSNASAS